MNINITILGQAISFIIFVLLCMKYLWPPIISVIEKRQKEIADMFASVEESKRISKGKQMEACNFLDQAKKEAKLIVARANQYKVQLIDQAKSEAKNEREKILSRAYQEIDIKKRCVSEELQREVGSMIIFGIEKILKHPINQCINEDIVDSIIKDLSYHNIIDSINHKE